MEYIKYPPKVVKRLRSFLVFHGQNEVKERFVVHFTLKSLKFLENSVYENGGETR
jgi:hypothetical protein